MDSLLYLFFHFYFYLALCGFDFSEVRKSFSYWKNWYLLLCSTGINSPRKDIRSSRCMELVRFILCQVNIVLFLMLQCLWILPKHVSLDFQITEVLCSIKSLTKVIWIMWVWIISFEAFSKCSFLRGSCMFGNEN